MGYYTYFELDVYDENQETSTQKEHETIEKALTTKADDEFLFEHEQKWYTYEEDCKHVSKKRPNKYIVITGNGDSSEDIWKDVWKNGKQVKQWCLYVPSFKELINPNQQP